MNDEKNYEFKLTVTDEDTGEVIYSNSAYSMESLEEQDHKMQSAIKKYEQDLSDRAEAAAEAQREDEESNG